MPQALRIVILREVKEVPSHDAVTGEPTTIKVTYNTYRLAFGGKLICREMNDKNLMLVGFAAYMFCASYHPEVNSTVFDI